jgi:hypothetical protein
MKIIGIIGTRARNTRADEMLVEEKFFELYQEGDWICSGDCKEGGDAFALKIARRHGIPILSFPPGSKSCSRQEYIKRIFARNDMIAATSDVLVACAYQPFDESQKGGTNYTVRAFKGLRPNTWHGMVHII